MGPGTRTFNVVTQSEEAQRAATTQFFFLSLRLVCLSQRSTSHLDPDVAETIHSCPHTLLPYDYTRNAAYANIYLHVHGGAITILDGRLYR
jgi:hypothetical protein